MGVLILIPLSGGKDSQASMLWAIEKYDIKNCQTAFCDVKWEAPETYKHIDYLIKKSGITHNVLKSTKYDGMVDLAIKKGRFPSTTARFCTQELKVFPMIDFVLSLETNVIIVDGIRADESESRSKKNPQCRFFKYYFEPYQTNSMIVERFNKKPPTTHKQKVKFKKAIDRLKLGKEDPKFYTYRKKEVFKWCEKYGDDLIRPFFNSSGNDVINFSLNKGFDINPKYFQGYKRVGCKICVMENIPGLTNTILNDPLTVSEIIEAEQIADSSFLPPDKIPKRYHSKKTKEGKSYATFEDVVRYISDKNVTADMFEDDPVFKCKSVYAICE